MSAPPNAPSRARRLGGRLLLGAVLVGAALAALWLARPSQEEGLAPNSGDVDATPLALRGRAPPVRAAHEPTSTFLGTITGTVRRLGEAVPSQVSLVRAGDRALQRALEMPWSGTGARWAIAAHRLTPPAAAEPLARARAPEGRFALGPVPEGLYVVRAQAPGGLTGLAYVEVTGEREETTVEVEIPGGRHVLRGRAVHVDGRPFQGIVSLGPDHFSEWLFPDVAVHTEADGSFALGGLLPAEYRISATSPGRLHVSREPVFVPHDGTYLFRVDLGMVERSGRVVDLATGAPVPGARVLLKGFEWGPFGAAAHTDEQGSFRIWSMDAGPDLRIEAEGFAPQEMTFQYGDTREMLARLLRYGRVEGRVRSAGGGDPIAGAEVVAAVGHHVARTTTDEEGRYAIEEVAPGAAIVVVQSDVWVMHETPSRRVAHPVLPGETTVANLVVERGASIGGTVVDAAGEAVSEATVRMRGPRFPGAPDGSSPPPRSTAEDGRFGIGGLVAGSAYEIEVQARGTAPHRQALEAGRDTDAVVRLPPPRHVVVRVTDADSRRPIAGARVDVHHGRPEASEGLQVTGTDAQGRARVDALPPGWVSVQAQASGYLPTRVVAVDGSAGDAPALEVALPLVRGHAIEGRVVVPEGLPIEGLEIWAHRVAEDESTESAFLQEESVQATTLRADGSFRFDAMAAEAFQIHAQLDGHEGEARAGGGDRDVVVVLRPDSAREGPRLEVHVYEVDGAVGGSGMLAIRGRASGGGWGDSVQYLSGWASYRLPPDADLDGARIVVHPGRDAQGMMSEAAPAVVGPLANGMSRLDVHLRRGCTIEGRILDPTGRPAAGVPVQAALEGIPQVAADAGLTGGWAFHSGAHTWADGTFRIGRLLPNQRYRVGTAHHTLAGAVRGDAVVVEAPRRDLVIALRSARPRTVRVETPTGAPAAGALVQWFLDTPRESLESQATGPDGRATSRHLAPDVRYRVLVIPPLGNRWQYLYGSDAAEILRFKE